MEKLQILNEKYSDEAVSFSLSDGHIDYGVIYETPGNKIEGPFITKLKADAVEYISNSTFPELVLQYPDAIIGCKKSVELVPTPENK